MSPPDGTPAARPRIAPRLAKRSDLPAINDLNAVAYAVYRTRMDRLPAPVSHDYTPEIEAGQVWVILDPVGRLALLGVIVLIPADDSLLIENVAVAPAAQGRGLGRRLMEFAELRAAAQGISRLTLYTNEVMTENLAIYAKLGYRETRRCSDDGYNRVFMEKHLARARPEQQQPPDAAAPPDLPTTATGHRPHTGAGPWVPAVVVHALSNRYVAFGCGLAAPTVRWIRESTSPPSCIAGLASVVTAVP